MFSLPVFPTKEEEGPYLRTNQVGIMDRVVAAARALQHVLGSGTCAPTRLIFSWLPAPSLSVQYILSSLYVHASTTLSNEAKSQISKRYIGEENIAKLPLRFGTLIPKFDIPPTGAVNSNIILLTNFAILLL